MKKALTILLGIWMLSSCSSSSDGSTESPLSQSVADSIYRPGFHFSPKKNWMGAPVSMVFHNNEYHLFYQYNAEGTKAKSSSWGHASSADMIKWTEQTSIEELGEYGSIVSDVNTSGLGQNVLVAIYTDDDELNLSYSADNGNSWIEYGENPILELKGAPKVSWVEETNKWIMTLTKETDVKFFSSEDLIHWSQESQLTLGEPSSNSELFALSNAWGLMLNRENSIDLMLGEFDGATFSPTGDAQPFDLGADNMSGTVLKTQDRSVFIGLMSNSDYMTSLPTKAWKSALTLPRTLNLNENNSVVSFPIKEINSFLIGKRRGKIDLLKSSSSNWYSFETVSPQQDLEVTIFNDGDEKMILKCSQSTFILDRSKSGLIGFDDDFPKVLTTQYASLSDTLQFDIFIDRSSIEIFINEGQVQFTTLVFPQNRYKSVGLKVDGESKNVPAILYDLDKVMY